MENVSVMTTLDFDSLFDVTGKIPRH